MSKPTPKEEPTPHELAKAAFAKWIPMLGLAWWDLEIVYYDDPTEIVNRFRNDDNGIVTMFVSTNWIYAESRVSVNLPALTDMTPDKIERTVVHELCHILVNEMREGELHHEERVVTGLTKAFMWTESMTKDGNE